MTPEEKTKLDEAIKWLSDEVGHVSYCSAIRGPDGEQWIEEGKCDQRCTKHKNALITAVETLKAENERLRAKAAANLIAETKALREHCDYLEGELTKSKEWIEAGKALENREWYGDAATRKDLK